MSAHNYIAAHSVRDLYSGASVRQAIRHVRTKLTPLALTREKRIARQALVRDALEAHARNHAMFAAVSRGL